MRQPTTANFMFLSICLAIAGSTVVVSGMSLGMTANANSAMSECLVIGCGVLGTRLCKQIVTSPAFATCKVTAATKTRNRHKVILAEVLGDQSSTNSGRFSVETLDDCKGVKFDSVVFCAPPSGFEDYTGAVKDAIEEYWSSNKGVFVFTSSGSIYGSGEDGSVVNERSPLADPEASPRSARLIRVEAAVLSSGGCTLRLAGLYDLNRGAHNFWITSGKPVSGRADGIVNQVHYDDAAGAVLAALLAGPTIVNGNPFLISDGNPMSRQEICASALKAKKYRGMSLPEFRGTESDPKGKIYDGAASNKALKWDAHYTSFDSFMTSES